MLLKTDTNIKHQNRKTFAYVNRRFLWLMTMKIMMSHLPQHNIPRHKIEYGYGFQLHGNMWWIKNVVEYSSFPSWVEFKVS